MRTILAVCAAVAAAGCGGSTSSPDDGGGGTPPPPSGSVTIQDYSFSPGTLTIKAGTTVRWTNNGPSAHTATSDDGTTWNSGTLGAPSGGDPYGGGGTAGGTYQFTFAAPGTYAYHCALHPPSLFPSFVGTITVTQ